MSKTRTIEFQVRQHVRFVVDEAYIAGERILYPEIAKLYDDDEQFIEAVLRNKLRIVIPGAALSLADEVPEGEDRLPDLRVKAGPPSVRRTDNFRKSIPVGAQPVLASEVEQAIPA